ncbi:MAG: recombinase [Comamonadaceae bacterium]|nr:MAG: recombinase [Comamonadaceae bacterium]
MKVYHCDQGSPEWHAARAGVITASMFKVARSRVGELDERQRTYVDAILKQGMTEAQAKTAAGYKNTPTAEGVQRALAGLPVGDWSDPAKNYAFRLAIERISGEALQDDKFETFAMRRGHELEPEARREHEVQAGVMVERCGFIVTDDGKFGCSTDGLIHPDGISEYKCLTAPEGIRPIVLDANLSEFTDQTHGGLWITGRREFHFGLYCPALRSIGRQLTLHIVQRDDDYITELERDLLHFDGLVGEFERQLRGSANDAAMRRAA